MRVEPLQNLAAQDADQSPPEMTALDTDVLGYHGERATVFLHGAGGDKSQLRPLADQLRPATAILPSLRGHGASPAPIGGFSPLDFSADLHRMAHGWPSELDLIGYSFGAVVAAVSAATWAATRTRSLVVLDTTFRPHPEFHENDEWAEGSWLRWTYDWRPVLARVEVPVLVIRSDDSELLDDAAVADLVAIPNVTVENTPGDHESVLEDLDALRAIIEKWQQ